MIKTISSKSIKGGSITSEIGTILKSTGSTIESTFKITKDMASILIPL